MNARLVFLTYNISHIQRVIMTTVWSAARALHHGVHIGGHEAHLVHGLHIPCYLGRHGLGNSPSHLALYTGRRHHQDRQQQNLEAGWL